MTTRPGPRAPDGTHRKRQEGTMTPHVEPDPPFVLNGTLHGTPLTMHPRRVIPMLRLSTAVATAVWTVTIAVIAELTAYIVNSFRDNDPARNAWFGWTEPWMLLLLLLPLGLLVFRWVRIPAVWSFAGYHLGDEEIHIRSGLLFRTMTSLAYARIQTVEVASGPIQRKFRLASLDISTAGSDLRISHIDPDTAAALRDQLTELARIERLPV